MPDSSLQPFFFFFSKERQRRRERESQKAKRGRWKQEDRDSYWRMMQYFQYLEVVNPEGGIEDTEEEEKKRE
jgi:hypothetical protein